MAEEQTDYIIIGGGTASYVLASYLYQLAPHLTVLLLGAGPDQHSNRLITFQRTKTPPQPSRIELQNNYSSASQQSAAIQLCRKSPIRL